ncbi:50S ribosomal protein L28 [Candidatus Uhrbacteria bacterium RIFCSPLOWO2_01_FULL_47_25]|uniref:Large ribosomal subunit protein bL28 n=1 Tax=Candidatus Uhrbacteria bacterium RIFCSPLOWO2_01_FULL_47_25 TaxID=1802402 RepID=A0A1F7UT32_9BACT|nr:MAG: 50S ribosomal protein L28 [Candidatus Uhrbacteria bacterium RIFCSPLOWO2_01_FULL_47_25]OGL84550.1 MAG: 50S ribosomal protein L28 [Candidatus Uhrbacteria bacterium RIFCSPLOWO2_02_FULL_46_19]
MSRVCSQCGRGALSAQSRSHSNIATKRRQFLNLQTRRLDDQKVKICTRCLRTMTKRMAAA